MAAFKWVKPDVYPLIFYIAAVVSMGGFQFGRMLSAHPDIRVNKEDRQTGLLYNYKEGRAYYDHALRRYLKDKPMEMMPDLNEYFARKNESRYTK